MKLPFLKPKKKSEPTQVHVKRKKVEAVNPDKQRIDRVNAYEKRVSESNLKRRSYGK